MYKSGWKDGGLTGRKQSNELVYERGVPLMHTHIRKCLYIYIYFLKILTPTELPRTSTMLMAWLKQKVQICTEL